MVSFLTSFAFIMKPSPHLAEFLPYLLSVASNAVSDRIAERYQERFDLKIAEWRVMAVLGDSAAHTQRELTELTLMDKVAVNRACKSLADKNFVSRRPNADDGRSHLLELTAQGRDIFEQIMPLALQMETRLFDALDEQEKTQLKDVLRKIAAHARAGR